jgi:type IV pilus biogenesis protein CpaD/CtpE
MIRSFLAACAAVALLSGCVSDGAGDLSHASDVSRASPHVGLVTGGRQLALHAAGATSTRRQLRLMLAAVGQGDVSAVSASIVAASPIEADLWYRTLLQLKVDPVRISMAVDPRQRAVIVLARTAVIPADCSATVEPAVAGDPPPSLESLGRCIQDNNLAAMLAHPTDLVAPPALGWGDGAQLAAGVSAWRGDQRQSGTAAGASGSSSSSAAPTAAK